VKTLTAKYLNEKAFFYLLVLIGLAPLIFTKYYLTLDGPGHIYNGNIIKELWLGNYPEFTNLFKFNQLPVPNWISHFLFACLNLIFPDYISEKIALASYLILFPVFFRKIVLWFSPDNKAFSYLGVLFAHNHLLYLGSYNMVFALVAFFVTSHFILKHANKPDFKQILGLSLLFLIVYFSHMLILLVTIAVALLLPLAALKIEKAERGFIVSGWNLFYTKFKVIGIAVLPTLLLTAIYILNVDSLEEAGRINLNELLKWIFDIRPLLTLCYCADWKYFSHGLTALFLMMIGTNLFFLVKKNCIFSDNSLKISVPQPTFSLIWFLLFAVFTILFLIVPNANILPERLIILVFLFLCFWLATQTYPRWVHKSAIFIILVIHIAFSFYHTRSMRRTSEQIELMKEVSLHIEPGSLLLPFNYAYDGNWLHMHSPGYFGSGKPIAVIENYEGQLKWFPINWNMEGKYELSPINVWAADNKKMIDHFYSNAQNPDVFSLPQKDGKIQEIPYAVIFGKMPDSSDPDFQKIKPILDKSYELIFQNGFCWLYRLGKNPKTN
jgi:hypothetical protein